MISLPAEILKGGHDRLGSHEAGVHVVGEVPVVRVFSALLRQVRSGPLRTEKVWLLR